MADLPAVPDRAPQSVLSDGTILRLVEEGRITIKPWDPERVQPASVDLRLGDSFRVFHNHRTTAIDLREPPANLTEEVVVEPGDQFVIHPGEFVLGRTLEWVELPDDIVARIEGKALALDTPIPTPTGWKLMDQLQIGDLVFDEHGRPTAVIDATEVMTGRECREVVFSDGTSLVCDRDHQWAVQTKYDRRCGKTRGADDARDGGPPPRRRARVRLPRRAGRAGPLLAEAPADRPLRARRLDRRRDEHQGRGHLDRRADPAGARARRLRGQARDGAARLPRRRHGPHARRAHRALQRATTRSTASCATSGCSATSTSRPPYLQGSRRRSGARCSKG